MESGAANLRVPAVRVWTIIGQRRSGINLVIG